MVLKNKYNEIKTQYDSILTEYREELIQDLSKFLNDYPNGIKVSNKDILNVDNNQYFMRVKYIYPLFVSENELDPNDLKDEDILEYDRLQPEDIEGILEYVEDYKRNY